MLAHHHQDIIGPMPGHWPQQVSEINCKTSLNDFFTIFPNCMQRRDSVICYFNLLLINYVDSVAHVAWVWWWQTNPQIFKWLDLQAAAGVSVALPVHCDDMIWYDDGLTRPLAAIKPNWICEDN